jgi:hypothetical protein
MAEAVGFEPTKALIPQLFSRQCPRPTGLLPLIFRTSRDRTYDKHVINMPLYQLSYSPEKIWWAEKDSNLRTLMRADLQSAVIAAIRSTQESEPVEGLEPPVLYSTLQKWRCRR